MIKRISYLIVFYSLLILSAIVFQSCCQGSVRIVGNGTMEIFNSALNSGDDITGPFAIYVYPETVISDIGEFGLMNSAYALSCDYPYDNNIVPNSIALTCDKAFEFDGMTIVAGTDLLDLDGVEVPAISNFDQTNEVLIEFTSIFIDQVVFEGVEHTFTISMSTNDGLDILNSASVNFSL